MTNPENSLDAVHSKGTFSDPILDHRLTCFSRSRQVQSLVTLPFFRGHLLSASPHDRSSCNLPRASSRIALTHSNFLPKSTPLHSIALGLDVSMIFSEDSNIQAILDLNTDRLNMLIEAWEMYTIQRH